MGLCTSAPAVVSCFLRSKSNRYTSSDASITMDTLFQADCVVEDADVDDESAPRLSSEARGFEKYSSTSAGERSSL